MYWLNNVSQEFFNRGYLEKGQTVADRIEVIGRRAEEILGIPGFAREICQYISDGWCSLSTPIWANFGTNRGLPISCVTGETWINTKTDGGKQARDITIGDEVLTHKGRYRKVTNIIKTENRSNIYKLKVGTRMTNLYLTGDHLVLTNLGWIKAEELKPDRHLVATNRNIELPESDYVVDLRKYCTYEYVEKDGRIFKAGSKTVKPSKRVETVSYYASPFVNISIDEDLAWAFGLWFAEGSIAKNTNGQPVGARITVNIKDEKKYGDLWQKVICDKFGINGGNYESKVLRNGKINSWYTINVHSKVIGNLFASFGKNCKEKTIPDWILNLPKRQLAKFLEGLLLGDGSVKTNGCNKLTLSNPKLLLQVYQIALKLCLDVSLQMQEKAGVLASTSHVYTIIFRSAKIGTARFSARAAIPFNDGLYYAPIRTIEKTERVDSVYDFTVEEDHSFSAAGVILHNCYGSYIDDSVESILSTAAEIGTMSKYGGGTSAYLGKIRPRGEDIQGGANGKTGGSFHFAQLYDVVINVISQGQVRRGNCAIYQDIYHKDIEEFLTLGDDGHPIQHLLLGLCIPDWWMEEMVAGDVAKRRIWAKVLEKRQNKGLPYLFFTDNVNRGAPDVYKDKGMLIHASNLCTEICHANDVNNSFVCDLLSTNVLHYDKWKNTNFVRCITFFLDSVMTEFIEKASKIKFMERAVNFAREQRALGIGQLGWHSYLQSKMIPFESMEAKRLNVEIAKYIQQESIAASKELAQLYGEPPLLKGYGRRNVTLQAIAPTQSSSALLGQVSKSIEPEDFNYGTKKLAHIKFTYKNPYLVKLLQEKELDNPLIWNSILEKGGSVQHLTQLSEYEKGVFKTFSEISQKEIVIQAAARQKYIDQSQSLNLTIHPSVPIKDRNALIIEGWRLGVKTFYYQFGASEVQEFTKNILSCASCEA